VRFAQFSEELQKTGAQVYPDEQAIGEGQSELVSHCPQTLGALANWIHFGE
jgi:hypothetical protein